MAPEETRYSSKLCLRARTSWSAFMAQLVRRVATTWLLSFWLSLAWFKI